VVNSQMSFSVIRPCASCESKNRVPAKHLADVGRCGACKQPLPPASEPVEVDASAFDQIVAGAKVPVLVDFWASWCGPCKMAAPEVHQLAREMEGRALVLKVDTEAHPALAARFGVQSIPNFVVLRGGKAVFQRAGLAPRAEMRRWLESSGGA
jgi:thioredoxin 2